MGGFIGLIDALLGKPNKLPMPGAPENQSAPVPKIALPGNAPTPATLPPVGPKLNPDYQAEQQQLDKGSGLDQFQAKHRILGTGLKIADVMGSFLAPKLAVNIPGTSLHHMALQQQLNRKENATQAQAINAGKPAAQEAQTDLQTAEAGHLDAETDALRNPAPAQAKHIGSYTNAQGQTVDKFQMPDGSVKEVSGGQTLEKDQKQETAEQMYTAAIQRGDHAEAERWLKVMRDMAHAKHVAEPPEPGNFIPMMDDTGHVTGAWNPKSGRMATPPQEFRKSANPAATKEEQATTDLEGEYAKAQAFEKNPSPTNDTQLVFSFVRSAVKGAGRMTNTEILQALQSGSLETRFSNAYNRAVSGQLDPTFRHQMVETIGTAAKAQRQHYQQQYGGGQQPAQEQPSGRRVIDLTQ